MKHNHSEKLEALKSGSDRDPRGSRDQPAIGRPPLQPDAKVKDPVCGMDVTPETAAGTVNYGGGSYFFCSAGCVDTFKATPGKYSNGTPQVGRNSAATEKKVEYTCPMHREFAASVRNGAADQGNWPRNSRIPMATFRSTLACPAGVGMRWPQAWHS